MCSSVRLLDSVHSAVLARRYGRNIHNDDKSEKKTIEYSSMENLMWIAYAQRPITEEEIVTAVAIEKNIEDLGTFRSIRPTAETLLAACTNLVTIDGNRCVRFVHFSVQEFLLSGRLGIVHRLEVLLYLTGKRDKTGGGTN